MRKTANLVRWMTTGLVIAVMIGCGGGGGTSNLEVEELGLSMELPSGWKVDRQSRRMFYDVKNRDDNYGLVEDYSLEGQPLSEYADTMSKAAGAKIYSKALLTISGHEAIELVSGAAYTVIEVDIKKGDRIIRVSMRTLKQDFSGYEESLRAALRSIKIK